jgi:hypothetical protein
MNDRLAPNQIAAVYLLVNGLEPSKAAAALGITTRTLTEWQSDPVFQETKDRLVQDINDVVRELVMCYRNRVVQLSRSWFASRASLEGERASTMRMLERVGHFATWLGPQLGLNLGAPRG